MPDDLPDKVRDLLTNRLDKTVYIKADKRAKYEGVEDVVDNLRAAGVERSGLADRADSRRRSRCPAAEGELSAARFSKLEEVKVLRRISYGNGSWRAAAVPKRTSTSRR